MAATSKIRSLAVDLFKIKKIADSIYIHKLQISYMKAKDFKQLVDFK